MQDIKFRGLHTESKKWCHGSFVRTFHASSGCVLIPLDGFGHHEVIKESVGQYTGLKDKNGKEVYEGDILITGHGDAGSIEWSDKYNGWRVDYGDEYLGGDDLEFISDDCEIIGNIYENSELLNDD
jgi:uncharacterized phage protein (TIGR01671 family)